MAFLSTFNPLKISPLRNSLKASIVGIRSFSGKSPVTFSTSSNAVPGDEAIPSSDSHVDPSFKPHENGTNMSEKVPYAKVRESIFKELHSPKYFLEALKSAKEISQIREGSPSQVHNCLQTFYHESLVQAFSQDSAFRKCFLSSCMKLSIEPSDQQKSGGDFASLVLNPTNNPELYETFISSLTVGRLSLLSSSLSRLAYTMERAMKKEIRSWSMFSSTFKRSNRKAELSPSTIASLKDVCYSVQSYLTNIFRSSLEIDFFIVSHPEAPELLRDRVTKSLLDNLYHHRSDVSFHADIAEVSTIRDLIEKAWQKKQLASARMMSFCFTYGAFGFEKDIVQAAKCLRATLDFDFFQNPASELSQSLISSLAETYSEAGNHLRMNFADDDVFSSLTGSVPASHEERVSIVETFFQKSLQLRFNANASRGVLKLLIEGEPKYVEKVSAFFLKPQLSNTRNISMLLPQILTYLATRPDSPFSQAYTDAIVDLDKNLTQLIAGSAENSEALSKLQEALRFKASSILSAQN
eukprot:Sdes_comp20516_c0_seq1m15069